MSGQFEELEIEDALTAALRVSGTVKNADGYDELVSAIAHRYAQRTDFNRAVEIADTINDPFTMEKTIAEIAVMLAAAGQEEPAFELIDSLEDLSHQATAKSQIAVAQAAAGEFDRAIEIASGMDDNSSTLVDIAYQCADKGQHDRALDVMELLDFPLGAVWVRIRVAQDYHKAGRTEEALELLSEALIESEAIDPPNERTGALTELAVRFSELGHDEKSAEVLSQAVEVATEADEASRDEALSQIASGHARLKHYDEAVSITEKIESVYLATSTLIELAIIEHEDDARLADAVLLLSDAHDLIVEDEPQSQRDEAQHNYLLSRIALSYAYFGRADDALKAARVIGAIDAQIRAVSEVTAHFADSGEFDQALMTARSIEDETRKAHLLIRISRTMVAASAQERGIDILTEASRLVENIERPLDKVQVTANLAIAYAEAGQKEHAVPLITQALQLTKSIGDAEAKASALLSISDACARTEYELDEESKEMLWEISTV